MSKRGGNTNAAKPHPHLGQILNNLSRRQPNYVVPSHFIHIPITDPIILRGVDAVASAIVAFNPALADTMIWTHRTHISLCLLKLYSNEDVSQTAKILRESQQEFVDIVTESTKPIAQVVGLGTFGDKVVFAEVKSEAIFKIQRLLQERLTTAGLFKEQSSQFVAHITICKLTSQEKTDKKDRLTSIPPESWQHMQTTSLGSFVPTAIHMCEMPWTRLPTPVPKAKPYHLCETVSLIRFDDPRASTRIVIFDFDNTLFRPIVPNDHLWTPDAIKMLRRSRNDNSSNSSNNNGFGWFRLTELLESPFSCVEQGHMIPDMVNEAKRWMQIAASSSATNGNGNGNGNGNDGKKEGSVTTALVTGRNEVCRDAVTKLVQDAGLRFDHVFFCPGDGVSVVDFKIAVINSLVAQHTHSTHINNNKHDHQGDHTPQTQHQSQDGDINININNNNNNNSSNISNNQQQAQQQQQDQQQQHESSVLVEVYDDNENVLQAATSHNRGGVVLHNALIMAGHTDRVIESRDEELRFVTRLVASRNSNNNNNNNNSDNNDSDNNSASALVPQLSHRAIVLDQASKQKLHRAFPAPENWNVLADHVMLDLGTQQQQQHQQQQPQGNETRDECVVVEMVVDAVAMSDQVMAVRIALPTGVISSTPVPHIMMAVNHVTKGAKQHPRDVIDLPWRELNASSGMSLTGRICDLFALQPAV